MAGRRSCCWPVCRSLPPVQCRPLLAQRRLLSPRRCIARHQGIVCCLRGSGNLCANKVHCRLYYEAPSRSSGCRRPAAVRAAGHTATGLRGQFLPPRSRCEGVRDCILRTKGAGAGARNAKLLTHLFLTYYIHCGTNTGGDNKGHTQTGPREGRGSRGLERSGGHTTRSVARMATVDLPPWCEEEEEEEAAVDFSVGARARVTHCHDTSGFSYCPTGSFFFSVFHLWCPVLRHTATLSVVSFLSCP